MRGTLAIVGLLLASIASASSPAGTLSSDQGGWASFYATFSGTSLVLRLEPHTLSAASFGVDLYAMDEDELLAGVRVDVEDDLTQASIQHGSTSVSLATEALLEGRGVLMETRGGFGCTHYRSSGALNGSWYEFELSNCTSLAADVRGIAFAGQDGPEAWSWEIRTDGAVTLAPHGSGRASFSLALSDLEGESAWIHGPHAVALGEAQEAVVSIGQGFFGAFYARFQGALPAEPSLVYRSPNGETVCPCWALREPGLAGERSFRIEGAYLASDAEIIIAGVDGRLPPMGA